jgi:hypothetical protein
MAVHQHRNGWRGSISLTTPVYKTKAEAEAALMGLKAQVAGWRSAQKPSPTQPRTLDPFRPSIDYPRSTFYFP